MEIRLLRWLPHFGGVLRRTPKTLLHGLPSLTESMKDAPGCLGPDNDSVAFHKLVQRVAEIQGMIRRTQGVPTEDVEEVKMVRTQ
jgi:hypothetical protein